MQSSLSLKIPKWDQWLSRSLTIEVEITRSYFVPRCTLHLRNLSENDLNYLYLVVGCLSSQGMRWCLNLLQLFGFFASAPDLISYFYFLILFYIPNFFKAERVIQYCFRQEPAFPSGWVRIFPWKLKNIAIKLEPLT